MTCAVAFCYLLLAISVNFWLTASIVLAARTVWWGEVAMTVHPSALIRARQRQRHEYRLCYIVCLAFYIYCCGEGVNADETGAVRSRN